MATSTTKKTTTSAKSTSKTTTAKKTTASKTTTPKKAATTKKTTSTKTASTSEFKVSAAEKKLIQNFRKCSDLEKQLLTAAIEKCASTGTDKKGGFDLSSITKLLGK